MDHVTLQRSVHLLIIKLVLMCQWRGVKIHKQNKCLETCLGQNKAVWKISIKVQVHMCFSQIRVGTSNQLPTYRCAFYRMSAFVLTVSMLSLNNFILLLSKQVLLWFNCIHVRFSRLEWKSCKKLPQSHSSLINQAFSYQNSYYL